MKEIKKLVELDFSETLVLGLIELDEDLCNIFREDYNVPFNILLRLAKDNQLPVNVKETLIDLFDNVIVTNSTLISKYLKLANDSGEKVSIKKLDEIKGVSEDISEPKSSSLKTIIDTITEVPEEKSKPIFKDIKKVKELPRRFGKDKILKEIEKQDGKPTNAQLTALSVNDLKNVCTNLSARLVKDMLTDEKTLTDEDYRTIRSTIDLLKNKFKPILKKK